MSSADNIADEILDSLRPSPPWEDKDGSAELASAVKAKLPNIDPRELIVMRRDILAHLQRNAGKHRAELKLDSITAKRLADLLLLGAAALERQNMPLEIALEVEGGAVQSVISDDTDPRPFRLYIHDHDLECDDGDSDEHATINFENGVVSEASLDVQTRGEFTETPGNGVMWTSLRSEAERLLDLD